MKQKKKLNVVAATKKQRLAKISGKNPKLKKKSGKLKGKKCELVSDRHLESMNVDEFFGKGIVESDDSDDSKAVANTDTTEMENEDNSSIDGDTVHRLMSDSGGSGFTESKSHKKSLSKLQNTDPELYSFLQANDKKLLEFDSTDSESDVHESDGEDDENVHQPPDKLEVASDDSENEAADNGSSERNVTLKLVKSWQENLQTDKTAGTIRIVVKAFHAALQRVSAEKDEESAEFKVDDSSVFNAVIQLCVLDLQPALKRFLRITGAVGHVQPSKCKRWVKIKILLRMYLSDLLQLLGNVTSSHILAVLLKHLHQMIPFLLCSNLSKPYLKKLIQFWSSGEETVRVVAFLCILRLSTSRHADLLQQVLKNMYIAYVNNCKFVSPNTLPGINFMRRSLVEIYSLDESASYQHVFLYVRQLAIHLRNAITVQKKEHHQAVYNWQFIHSLNIWVELLGVTSNKPQLQPLIYPLVQIIVGTLKLIQTAYYYPLRFHCVQMLIQLNKIGVFVPVLPFLLEVLNSYDFNKHHKKVSMKPQDFTCLLRVSKSQIQENGFKDAVIEKIYQQVLEYLAGEAHHISFPDLVIPAVIQIKKFIKTCKVTNYTKKFKQLLDKIEENSRFVENERRKISFSLTERKAIDAWESTLRENGVPLLTYYNSWHKLHLQQVAKRATENDKLGDFNIPVLKKFQKKRNTDQEREGPVELFPSDDSEDDNVLTAPALSVQKRKKAKNKEQQQNEVQLETLDVKDKSDELADDIIEEFKLSDLE